MPTHPHLRTALLCVTASCLTLAGVHLTGAALASRAAPGSAQPRPVAPRTDLLPDEVRTIGLFEAASPSVVFVTTLQEQHDPYMRIVGERKVGTGSGFIWDEHGHVVTNAHVILVPGSRRNTARPADRIVVQLADASLHEARLVGLYADKDLAVLRIDAPRERLKPIPLGTSHDLRVGQHVYAIGNPFGLDQTLTTGVVSALGRTIESLNGRTIEDVVQTDAAINPGNSGGPLLDSAGRLIGVNTQIASTSGASAGVGFAIPVDTVNRIVPQLIAFGKVQTPTLGVYLLDARTAAQYFQVRRGVAIRELVPDGPAHKAGLRGVSVTRQGAATMPDVIVGIDGHPIASVDDLFNVLEKMTEGQTVTVELIRDGTQRVTRSVTLGPPTSAD